MNVKRLIGKIIYHSIGMHLPMSSAKISFNSRKIRQFCAKLILGERCGDWVNIEPGVHFGDDVKIGFGSGVGKNGTVANGVTIGQYVMIGQEVLMITSNHRFDRLDIPMGHQGMAEMKPIVIGDDVWIGARVTILPGVHIGNGCVIGAGSVVTKNIPDYEIWGGNPAHYIRSRKTNEE